MIKVKIIKDYKMMKIGDEPMVEELYAAALIKRGVVADPNKKAKVAEKE